ncbi:MAG: ribbon-helix-helix protein, CopG family [Hydrococcus sp. CRU_1_1]|nr:ribbon-helix-helix protein, CopG family [Hydrococcus sp. CRU_1_1]
MATKKVGFKPKPNNPRSSNIEDWVSTRNGELVNKESEMITEEPRPKMKRLTIDVSEELHRGIKKKAADLGVPMSDLLRSLLENNYL